MTDHEFKRTYFRLGIDQITCLRKAHDDLSTVVLDAHICNVSVGGAFLETKEIFPRGCGVKFTIKIPSVVEGIPVLAIVRHVESGPITGIGVEFLGISPEHLKELTRYIHEYNRQTIQGFDKAP